MVVTQSRLTKELLWRKSRPEWLVIPLEDRPTDYRRLFEIIAQSPTGRRLLNPVLEQLSQGTLSLKRTMSHHAAPVTLESDRERRNRSTLTLNTSYSIGSLLNPLVRQLAFGVVRGMDLPQVATAGGSVFSNSLLASHRLSYQIGVQIFRELLRVNPDLGEYVILEVPSDSQLVRQFPLSLNELVRDQNGPQTVRCALTLKLLREARARRPFSGSPSPARQSRAGQTDQNGT